MPKNDRSTDTTKRIIKECAKYTENDRNEIKITIFYPTMNKYTHTHTLVAAWEWCWFAAAVSSR